jgi:hypothetical protein
VLLPESILRGEAMSVLLECKACGREFEASEEYHLTEDGMIVCFWCNLTIERARRDDD